MKQFVLFILLSFGLILKYAHSENFGECPSESEKVWALLAAGTYGWDNYRHQADISHAYRIFRSSGVPEENIIVMMYDDISCHKKNPTPDTIINIPGGPDVYWGMPKDYSNHDVSANNFLNILRGDKRALKGIGSGRVIESGPGDVVFVNYVGYGALGLLSFPEDNLFAEDLLHTIDFMYDNKRYSKLIIYIEANDAASMFYDSNLENKNVYVLTAVGLGEHSFAAYWDQERKTYLADVFSAIWMSQIEYEELRHKTISEMYKEANVNRITMEFGDLSLANLIDILDNKKRSSEQEISLYNEVDPGLFQMNTHNNIDASIDNRYRTIDSTKNPKEIDLLKHEIIKILEKRKFVDHFFENMMQGVETKMYSKAVKKKTLTNLSPENFPCYKRLVTAFSKKCVAFSQDPYIKLHLQKFVDICNGQQMMREKALKMIVTECRECANIPESYQNTGCSPGTANSMTCQYKPTIPTESFRNLTSEGEWIVVCQNQRMSLRCPDDQVLHIMDALWGRTDQHICGSYPDLYKPCVSIGTLHRVKMRCEGKRFCNIDAEEKEFTNPCPGFDKYLKVKYSCEPVRRDTMKSIILCNDDTDHIECEEGYYIYINNVFWGRKKNKKCGIENNKPECSLTNAMDIVSAKCDYTYQCELVADAKELGNPKCGKEYNQKLLKVDYQCIKETIKHKRVCENDELAINCEKSEIKIIEAHFGRSHPYICNHDIEPKLHVKCMAMNITTYFRESCEGKSQCKVPVETQKLGSFCTQHSTYLNLEYFCKKDEKEHDDADDTEIDVSPGLPIIVGITNHTVSLQYPKDLNSSYVLQIKSAADNNWFTLEKKRSKEEKDLDTTFTINHLRPIRTYDMRFILKECNSCHEICIPFVRFVTKLS